MTPAVAPTSQVRWAISAVFVPPFFRNMNVTYSLEIIYIMLCTATDQHALQLPTTLNSLAWKET